MKTETIELDEQFGKEYAGPYVFGEISWAKRSRIIQKHTTYNPITGAVSSSDFVAIQAETIWASLKDQPAHKPISLEKLLSEDQGVPIALGEWFSQIVNRLCGMTSQEQRFLSEPSDEESRIQHSPDLGLPKNSDGPQVKSNECQQKQSKNSV